MRGDEAYILFYSRGKGTIKKASKPPPKRPYNCRTRPVKQKAPLDFDLPSPKRRKIEPPTLAVSSPLSSQDAEMSSSAKSDATSASAGLESTSARTRPYEKRKNKKRKIEKHQKRPEKFESCTQKNSTTESQHTSIEN